MAMKQCNSFGTESMVSCEMQQTYCEISVVQMVPKFANDELKVLCLHSEVVLVLGNLVS